ncbi:galactokinase family protein [Brooklawnia cerclae]|uniref:Galactokinase n=1 Tax=Brooklawnia cerclae TaxID=349934 RepID=A0ABX0SIE4_9ACTN|nr:galactokinase [Brooklawnia cerclae]
MSGAAWFAPGRIEVLGKHTDYAGGNVLVCAIDKGVSVWAEPGTDAVEARSSASADRVHLRAGTPSGLPQGHWGRYLQTVVDRLASNFASLAPARLTIESDLPLASGMSSSSALVVACALALARMNGFDEDERWTRAIRGPVDLAGYLATIENGRSFGDLAGSRGVGTLGGSEDHIAMLCSEPDRLGLFSFAPPRLVERVPLADDLAFVVAISGVRAEKTGSAREAYNQASSGAAEILRRWNQATGRSDDSLAQAVGSGDDAGERLERLVADDDRLTGRLAQFVHESAELVPGAAHALAAADLDEFGRLAAASQRWAAEGLVNQVPETRALVELAGGLGAHAASSFGAGFGGSVWALVGATDAPGFSRAWLGAYLGRFPEHTGEASTIVTRPSGAAHPLFP